MHTRFVIWAILAGCGGTTFGRNFEAERAQAICAHAETCDPEGFSVLWGSPRECVRDYEGTSPRSAAAFSKCDLVDADADACLDEIGRATRECTDLQEVLNGAECVKVWNCPATLCDEAEDTLENCNFRLGYFGDGAPDEYCLPETIEYCFAECGLAASCSGIRPGNYNGPLWESYQSCQTACRDEG